MTHEFLNTTYLHQIFSKYDFSIKEDGIFIAIVLDELKTKLGPEMCWDIKKIKSLYRFTTSHASIPVYKGKDVRPLLLALTNTFKVNAEHKLIRSYKCKSKHCINPTHYFYGDNLDLKIQGWQRKGINVDRDIYHKILKLRNESPKTYTYEKLSEVFSLSIRTIRTICSNPNV